MQTLDSLTRLRDFHRVEVLICGRIEDAQVQMIVDAHLARYTNLQHFPIKYELGDSSEKKNYGWHHARADIIAFLDDDVVLAENWVQEIMRPFEEPAVGGVSGPSLVPPDVGVFAHLAGTVLQSKAAGYVSERYSRGTSSGAREVNWSRIIGCNMAYRRDVLEAINGFEPEFWPGEEMLAAYRADQQCRLMFNPDAWVYHYPRVSLSRFWKQMHGYGATRIRLVRAGVEFEPATVVPAVWALSLLVLMLLSPVCGWCRLLLLLDLLTYFAADCWITVSKVRETGLAKNWGLLWLIPVMHLSYGLGEWVELFRPGKDLSVK